MSEREDQLAAEVADLRLQLLRARRLEVVGRLASGVAHDFNNLLTVVNGYAHLLLERAKAGEGREELEEILQAGERAAVHTRQILSFARRRSAGSEDVDLTALVEGLAGMLERILGEDVRLVVRVPPEPVLVRGDAAELELALANLAANARDAMPRGGKLTLELRREGARAHLEVKDDGDGMDEETRARCLDPYYTTKDAERSCGLGLSTVDETVRAAGGEVAITSAPGRGTTVALDLPVVDAVASSPEPLLPDGPRTVLVVEDERALRALLERCLTAAGFEVLSAADADAALDLAAAHEGDLDLVLTDIVLPNADGRNVARKLLESRPGLAVLYMSGYADEVIPDEGAAEVAGHLLRKPFTPTALVARVREALSGA